MYVLGEYTWAGQRHRIEWEKSLNSWIVRKENPTTNEWDVAQGVVPVNEVAVLLGAPRKIKDDSERTA